MIVSVEVCWTCVRVLIFDSIVGLWGQDIPDCHDANYATYLTGSA